MEMRTDSNVVLIELIRFALSEKAANIISANQTGKTRNPGASRCKQPAISEREEGSTASTIGRGASTCRSSLRGHAASPQHL
jgi:hypothetical protein